MLDAENKKMEDKLRQVQGLMAAEQSKKGPGGPPAASNSGQMWRSSKQTSNHAKDVLEQHKKALQGGLKPSMPKPSAAQAK